MSKLLSLTQCEHCGTPFEGRNAERFCCAGCSFVHGLIHRSGLDKFYQLRGQDRILPATNAVLNRPDTQWAADLQVSLERTPGEIVEAPFDLQGVSCIGCVWLLDALFKQQQGGVTVIADPHRGEITLSWIAGEFDLPRFIEDAARFGYRIAEPSTKDKAPSGASGLRLGLCGGLAMNAMAFTLPRYLGMGKEFALADLMELVAAFTATLSLIFGGSYFVHRALAALRFRQMSIDVPIAGGVVAAWIGSIVGWLTNHASLLYFDFVAVFIFLMLLGRRLQEVSVGRNRNRLLRGDPLLRQVWVNEDGQWRQRPIADLTMAVHFRVPSGGVIPVTSRLESPDATGSLEWINGESEPRQWRRGAMIPAGALNLSAGEMELTAAESWQESLLQRLSQGGAEKHASDSAMTRWLRFYLSVIIVLALLGGAVWMWRMSWTVGLQVFISVLVVSCPCALGVALPMAHELAVATLRRDGLFVRSADLWARLRRVRKIVFDKTGTLTFENPQLRDKAPLLALDSTSREALAHLIRSSRHPISAALREELASWGHYAPDLAAEPAYETPGFGLTWKDAPGSVWQLRKPAPDESGDVVFVRDGIVLAGFSFTDGVRHDAREQIALFQQQRRRVFILSGDREEKVQAMADSLQVPAAHAKARQSPEEKAAWMRQNGTDALFVGDGANDSLAADAALVVGTPAIERCLLAEKADFYFLSRSLRPLRRLFDVGSKHQKAVLHAFIFAVAYNIVVVLLALLGKMNPLLAAILMPLSSLVTLAIVSSYFKRERSHY